MANIDKLDYNLRYMRDHHDGKTVKNVCIAAECLYIMCGGNADAMRTAYRLAVVLQEGTPAEREYTLSWLHNLRDTIHTEPKEEHTDDPR